MLFEKLKKEKKINNDRLYEKITKDYNNNTFAILKYNCKTCGLFGYYIHYLACIQTYLTKGFIPVVDLSSFPNIFINEFNLRSENDNPWEYLFNQPFEFHLKEIKKKAKNIKYFQCIRSQDVYRIITIYKDQVLMEFWHNIALKYIPIKKEIIKEVEIIKNLLFKKSSNILGILSRGTDYTSKKPKNHPIPPKPELMIKDIIEMNNKNKYDWFFIATEDELIRLKFIKEFGNKLKYVIDKNKFIYNYKNPQYLCKDKNIKGNMNYAKLYLINIIILSKCIDFISAKTNGCLGVLILSNGFRNTKIYNLGYYK